MKKIILALAVVFIARSVLAVGPLINGNQINPQTAISISTLTVTGAGGMSVANSVTASSFTASGSGFVGAGTGLTGTASSLTSGHVTTNANLTGDVTSVGNAATNVKASSGFTVIGQETVTSTMTVQGNAFSVGGSTFVCTGGLCGIGTTNPQYAFQANIPGNSTDWVSTLNNENIINAGLLFNDQGGGGTSRRSFLLGVGQYVAGDFAIDQSTAQYFDMTNTAAFNTRFYIGPSGFAGIGTTAPSSSLSVQGIITSSTPIPSVACTLGSPTMTAGSTSEFGSYSAGTGATGCTVTFATAFPNAHVFCQCQASANLLVYASASSASSVTCTSATAMTGDTISYLCRGGSQ